MTPFFILALLTADATDSLADGLHIAISRRIPCVGDTVKLAAYQPDWSRPEGTASVVFSAQLDGKEALLGKALVATDASRPFDPCVEWTPRFAGMYRVTARLEGTEVIGRLLVPVVAQRVFFCWYGQTRPEVEWMTHHLTATEEEIPALHARGALALKPVGGVSYVGGARWQDDRPEVDFATLAPQVVRDYTEIGPYDGISIDELGMWEQHPDQTTLAMGFWEILKQARAARPDSFVAAWQFGALNPLECNIFRDTVDLVMCEVYQNYFRAWYDQHTFYEYIRQRVDVARAMMIAKKTVIGLSITTLYGGVTPEELEDQIRAIRTLGPELPGVAFFTTSKCRDDVLRRANDCCFRYWVKPAVALFSDADLLLSDTQPEHDGNVRVLATVHNVGGMEARDLKLRFWDGDPANGGKQIAEEVVPRLPAARWIDPDAMDNASWEPPESMRRDGFGMVTVAATWRARRGPHELWAEIVPSQQYTIIRGMQSRRITVR